LDRPLMTADQVANFLKENIAPVYDRNIRVAKYLDAFKKFSENTAALLLYHSKGEDLRKMSEDRSKIHTIDGKLATFMGDAFAVTGEKSLTPADIGKKKLPAITAITDASERMAAIINAPENLGLRTVSKAEIIPVAALTQAIRNYVAKKDETAINALVGKFAGKPLEASWRAFKDDIDKNQGSFFNRIKPVLVEVDKDKASNLDALRALLVQNPSDFDKRIQDAHNTRVALENEYTNGVNAQATDDDLKAFGVARKDLKELIEEAKKAPAAAPAAAASTPAGK